MRTIEINNRLAGGDNPVLIIAEIGSNHNRDLNIAKESVYAAAESGADAVKTQFLNVEEQYFNPSQEIIDLHRKIDMDEEWHAELKACCDSEGILFLASPTYLRAVDMLEEMGVDLYKLASAQAGTFPRIVEKVASTGKPIILSSGIVSYGELEKAVRLIESKGNNDYIILHCNSIYPCPPDKVNLPLIRTYIEMFGCPVGFSDHTLDISIPAAAVALGASVIEKHFILDKKIITPDSEFSLDPRQFSQMVRGIRDVEKALTGHARTIIEPEEKRFKQKILYRLIAKKEKSEGDSFAADDFVYKRNPEGIDCREEKVVVENFCAAEPIAKDSLIRWNQLKGRE